MQESVATSLGKAVFAFSAEMAIGIAAGFLVDPLSFKVRALEVKSLISDERFLLNTEDVLDWKKDSVFIQNEEVLYTSAEICRAGAWQTKVVKLIGFKVLNQAGVCLGWVKDFSFEANNFLVTQLESSHKRLIFWSTHSRLIPRRQIMKITKETVIIQEQIGEVPIGEEKLGIMGKISIAEEA
ncbi:hypothetical protein COT40_00435 [Candidatus Peregrinibacteria bacterium CG08_land_8_20_14_0_20_41_10]|nr:MAG: hypothetical protein AUJ78_00645 [Candidatus Peregrinibacteria bacterium CG1_02_41_10]PIS32356.1 MAG: hypothetical protein COT40_00435 [Candidatus Peregrinibacteria bacterium CG08_land_8_20_14_0_20_41_10]